MSVAHSSLQQDTTSFCTEPISLTTWLCKHFAQYRSHKWDLQRGESNTLMGTHSDDSCQQHRGKYQYIADDLLYHAAAVDLESACHLIDIFWVCGVFVRLIFRFSAIAIWCCSLAMTLNHDTVVGQRPETPMCAVIHAQSEVSSRLDCCQVVTSGSRG